MSKVGEASAQPGGRTCAPRGGGSTGTTTLETRLPSATALSQHFLSRVKPHRKVRTRVHQETRPRMFLAILGSKQHAANTRLGTHLWQNKEA